MVGGAERYGRHVDAEHTGEGGGREFRRVLETLRSRMLDGTYPLNSLLPPQRELALELDVSRDTVQRVLRELSDEGWVRSRRGSGSKVIKTQRIQGTTPPPAEEPVMTLGRVIGSAFEQDEVTLDVCTLTSESLGIHVRLLLDRIRAGQSTAPRSIDVRLMLPAESVPWPYPVNVADPADDRPRERLREIARRSTATLEETLYELKSENFVTDVRLQIRHAPTVPDFKVYLLNKNRMLYGTYKAIRRKIRLSTGESVDVVDVLGLDAALLYFSGDGGHAVDAYMVDDMQTWFDSRWELLTEEGVTAQGAAAPPA
nr:MULTISPECIES: GntR family transcriptional regulator [unclassified Streptomyces]